MLDCIKVNYVCTFNARLKKLKFHSYFTPWQQFEHQMQLSIGVCMCVICMYVCMYVCM